MSVGKSDRGSVDYGGGVGDMDGGIVRRSVVNRGIVTDDALGRHRCVVAEKTGVGGCQHNAKSKYL